MILTVELKFLDDKINTNEAQYDLDREATKISALSSKELDKHEYLTGEVSGYRPGVVEKVKFEYLNTFESVQGLISIFEVNG